MVCTLVDERVVAWAVRWGGETVLMKAACLIVSMADQWVGEMVEMWAVLMAEMLAARKAAW